MNPARTDDEREDSLERWRRLAGPLLSPPHRRLHRRFAAILYITTELARRAREDDVQDVDLITSSLIDIVIAILSAPVRPATKRMLRAHAERRAHPRQL